MKEFRDQSARLARAAKTEEAQQAIANMLGSLNHVLTKLREDVQELKARVGAIADDATKLAADEVRAEIHPLTLRVEAAETELRTLADRVEAIEQEREDDA